jgi:hypothetical protein
VVLRGCGYEFKGKLVIQDMELEEMLDDLSEEWKDA